MTLRRLISCLFILISVAVLMWLQNRSFAQSTWPGGGSGVSQPGATGVYSPPYQQPAAGVPTGGYPNTGLPTTGGPMAGPINPNPAMGQVAGGQATSATVPGTAPPTNHMLDRPMGVLPGGPQPANPAVNPPQGQIGRQVLPPPIGYQLSPEKQDYITRFLAAWQEQSKNIEALDYEFTCRENTAFGVSETYGRVKFRAPDKGVIEIDSELINGKKSFETNKKMKVICTGDAVYEFNFEQKKLIEHIIPVDQRGKGVMDSPLMILAGANPRELQERFYLDVLPSPASLANCVCIQAWPKWLEDGKEFKYVTVAIDRQTFQAKVMLLYEPGSEDCKGFEITKMENRLRDRLLGTFSPSRANDDFDRGKILLSMPKGWVFETKKDFLPEASGQQYAHQPYPPVNAAPAPVSPPYANPSTIPGNNPVNNTFMPGTGAPGYTNGATPAMQQPPGQPGSGPQGVVPQGTLPTQAIGVTPPYHYPNNPPLQNNQYMAMPPQGNSGSPSVIR